MLNTLRKLFLILAILASGYSFAQDQTGVTASCSIDIDTAKQFFDEFLSTKMEENNVAGVGVSVVKDDRILFEKGYGYADISQNIEVDPGNTVFILGSLSKLFTWTAVMQLVEQGKLDLDENINTYLDFEIPDTYPEPITIKNLMSHNSGFEDIKFDQMAANAEQLIPLEIWIKTHIPERVFPTGKYIAYGNYSAALAGYIIRRVSGISYDDYIDQNILNPLGMKRSTIRQPVSHEIESNMSNAYIFANGEYRETNNFNVAANVAPAGAIRSTASDMARFMIAHLNEGLYGNMTILEPATTRLMHRQSFTHDTHVNGMAHGFWEFDMNGQDIIGHAGSHFIFNSLMLLFPEHKLGVFIATNSQGGSDFIGSNYLPFLEAFTDTFFQDEIQDITPVSGMGTPDIKFNGQYHMTFNRSESTPEKLSAMIMSVNIQTDKSGLNVTMPGGTLHFSEVSPLVFINPEGSEFLAFEEDEQGNIVSASYDPYPLTALLKSKWFETPIFNILLIAACIIIFLSVPITTLVKYIIRGRNRSVEKSSRNEIIFHWTASLTSLGILMFLFLVFSSLFNLYGLYTGNVTAWNIVWLLSIILTLLLLGVVSLAIICWIRNRGALILRIHMTLAGLSGISFIWFMYFWNLLATWL